MENILDYVFYFRGILIIWFIVLIIIASWFTFFTNFFKNKVVGIIFKATVFALPFAILILGTFIRGAYGFSDKISVMGISNDNLCMLDKKVVGDEMSDWEEYRLHVLDAKTGLKKSRKFYEDINDFTLLKEDRLMLFNTSLFILVDIQNNKIIREINNKYLSKRFPELSFGIESIRYSKENINGSRNFTITIEAKTAKTYHYDPLSDKLLSNEIIIPQMPGYYLYNDRVYYKSADNKVHIVISLISSRESYKIKHLVFANDGKTNPAPVNSIDFLEGKILEVFAEQKIVIIISYETTDKLEFIISSVGFDGNLKWRLKRSDLKLDDHLITLNSCTKYNENLIFNCGGYIFSINVITRKINWKQRV